MKLNVLDSKGKDTGRSVELPNELFGVEPNEHVVYLAVKAHLAAKRQGTHKTKERGEIAGSTRKIKKQKGTGTARAGSIKNPLFRSGGTIFGPRPRNYTLRLNKKERLLARASALSQKANNNAITLVEELSFDKPKTKEFVSVINALNTTGKVLFVHDNANENVIRSARNVAKLQVSSVDEISTYQLLHADQVIFSENAINKIVKK